MSEEEQPNHQTDFIEQGSVQHLPCVHGAWINTHIFSTDIFRCWHYHFNVFYNERAHRWEPRDYLGILICSFWCRLLILLKMALNFFF